MTRAISFVFLCKSIKRNFKQNDVKFDQFINLSILNSTEKINKSREEKRERATLLMYSK